MNLYVRYFDKETLAHNIEEVMDFLYSIGDIEISPMLEEDLHRYVTSDACYPKRYKVRPRVYFIVIKTEAPTMRDFKEKKNIYDMEAKPIQQIPARYSEDKFGWYEGTIDFKRVQQVPGTNKFQYRDIRFIACCKASSSLECYDRIVKHLRGRVDPRSQFPSPKGKNFHCRYMGSCKQYTANT